MIHKEKSSVADPDHQAKKKKNIDPYSFVTSFWLLIFWRLGHWRKQQDQDISPLPPPLNREQRRCICIISVADPGCLFRIPDLDFYHSGSWFLPIPDPGSKNSNLREGGKIFLSNLFVVTNFTKLLIILILKCWRKEIWANFQRIIELFTQKIVTKLSKYGFGIRDPEKSHSGSRIQGSKRHQIPDPDLQHCVLLYEHGTWHYGEGSTVPTRKVKPTRLSYLLFLRKRNSKTE